MAGELGLEPFEAFTESCRELGFEYFQGYFLSKPKVIKGQSLPASKLAVLRLLSEVQNPEADPDDPGGSNEKMTQIIVPTDTPGFDLIRSVPVWGHRSGHHGEIIFDNCRVPADNLMGEENSGFKILMDELDTERTSLAAGAVGHLVQGHLARGGELAHEPTDQPWGARDFAVVDAHEMLETAFARFNQCSCKTLPVVHQGQLVGMVTMDNVGEFLAIHGALERIRRTRRT